MKKAEMLEILYGKSRLDNIIKPTEEYLLLLKDAEKQDKAVRESLSKQQLSLYINAIDAVNSMYDEKINFYYEEGFKSGLLIGLEINKANCR